MTQAINRLNQCVVELNGYIKDKANNGHRKYLSVTLHVDSLDTLTRFSDGHGDSMIYYGVDGNRNFIYVEGDYTELQRVFADVLSG